MIIFTILGWIMAAIALLVEIGIYNICFNYEEWGLLAFLLMSAIWFFVSWLAFLLLGFVASFFGVLVSEYGEERVIGGTITILLFGFFIGR